MKDFIDTMREIGFDVYVIDEEDSMTEELEYVHSKRPGDARLYRVRRYLKSGDVELLVVEGDELYSVVVLPIDELEPIERDPYDVLGSVSPAD